MRIIYLAILAGFLAGCGKGYNGRGWPPEVDGLVRAFYDVRAQVGGVPIEPMEYLTIEFRDTSDAGTSVVGYCQPRDEEGYVALDPEFWGSINDATRRSLLFHELGHCAAWQDHRGTILKNGMPSSLMYPYVVSGWWYGPNQDYFDRELFQATPTRTTAMMPCTLTRDQEGYIVAE